MAVDKREEENTTPKKKAIVIGVSDYNTNLQPLNFCKKDGIEMCELLTSLGYEISDNHRLIGHVGFNQMREAIYDFFDNSSALGNQTLLFYFSGHGVPSDGDMCLASSEINPDEPYRKGFSSYELTRLMQGSVSLRVVTILDCCYSGAAKLSKGHEDDAAKIATDALRSKARILQGEQQGEGKCLLAASQAAQEAYGLKKQEHSIFTYYLLEGLRGNERSVDTNGNVTPYSLGSYVYKAILNLPPKKRPKQKPVTKVEASGDIILAEYPELAKRDSSAILTPISSSGLLFYSLPPQQMSPPVQQEHLSLHSPVSSPYSLDDVGRKVKREQNIAAPIRPKVEEKKQLLSNSKVMMLIVAVISSIVAFVVVGAIHIQPNNHLPSATNESVTTEMNTPVNATLEGGDPDKNNTITAAIITPPSHGTLGDINQVSGVVTYTPHPGFSGKDKFTFKVNDGIADSNNVGTVSISVNQLPLGNHPPSATNESVTTEMNTPVNATLEGGDPDKNNTITAAIITPPSHGTLGDINQVSGVVTYTPNRNFAGNDSFTYNVNDGQIDSNNIALVKIRVGVR
jgi:Caspase domain/Bacterial Ig domain